MTATNKLPYFKRSLGGSGPVNAFGQPGAAGTWAAYTGGTEAAQAAGQVAAGYISFDEATSASDATLTEYRIPVYRV